jgi:hypothetical protein
MNVNEIVDVVLKTAQNLDPSISKMCSAKYPKHLGFWGLKEDKLDELKRHLSKQTVELKVYDLDTDEFPKLDKDIVELELKSTAGHAQKVIDILKRIKAFPIEEHHVSNLKEQKSKESHYNTGLSGLEITGPNNPVKNIEN